MFSPDGTQLVFASATAAPTAPTSRDTNVFVTESRCGLEVGLRLSRPDGVLFTAPRFA